MYDTNKLNKINKEDIKMNELKITSKGIKMNHAELCELINKLRVEEGNRKKLRTPDLMTKIRKEVEVLESLGLVGERNISSATYLDKQGKERPTYEMNRDGILQIASSESTYVRAKIIEYINALEEKISNTLTKKQELQLQLFSDDSMEVVNAHKQLVQMEVEEATQPLLTQIEEDKPKVTFANRVLKSKDNILVRQLAKIASDEGYIIGERRLYNKLREWGYICKNSTEPTQRAMNSKYFIVKLGTINTPYGIKETKTTLVTPAGQIHIVEKLMKEL